MFKKGALLGKLGLGKDDDDKKSRQPSPLPTRSTGSEDDSTEVILHPDAHEEGGLSCNNDELLKLQQKAILKWMKSMGQKLITGNINVLNTPFPVDIFEPRSYLEKLADVWVYPRYLQEAADCTNPLERLKLVITWFIAGLHHSFEKWKKPFNPILGETWQASLSDGSAIFMEQISHHPPVSAFHIEGPGSAYRFVGLSQPTVSLLLKHYGFKTVAKGYRYVEFVDGTHVDIVYPTYCMKGVVYSSRPRAEVEGTAIFTDARNHLKAVVHFGSNKGTKGFLKRADAVVGAIYDTRGVQGHTAASEPVGGSLSVDSDDDEFESASETDWDVRDLRDDRSEAEVLQDLKLAPPDGREDSDGVSHPSGLSGTSAPAGRVTDDGKHGSNHSGMFSKVTGLLGFSGTSHPEEQSGKEVSRLEGSWLSHLDIDGKRFWSLVKEKPDTWVAGTTPLASDSRFRQDLAALTSGDDIKEVQRLKEELEHRQRHEAKLRGLH